MATESRKTSPLVVLLAWLLLSVLAGYVAWQVHVALLVVVTAWLQSDLPRPLSWATWTLSPISRASILLLGSAWLIGVLWLERDLGQFPKPRAFWGRVGNLLRWQIGILAFCWLVVFLLS